MGVQCTYICRCLLCLNPSEQPFGALFDGDDHKTPDHFTDQKECETPSYMCDDDLDLLLTAFGTEPDTAEDAPSHLISYIMGGDQRGLAIAVGQKRARET